MCIATRVHSQSIDRTHSSSSPIQRAFNSNSLPAQERTETKSSSQYYITSDTHSNTSQQQQQQHTRKHVCSHGLLIHNLYQQATLVICLAPPHRIIRIYTNTLWTTRRLRASEYRAHIYTHTHSYTQVWGGLLLLLDADAATTAAVVFTAAEMLDAVCVDASRSASAW